MVFFYFRLSCYSESAVLKGVLHILQITTTIIEFELIYFLMKRASSKIA